MLKLWKAFWATIREEMAWIREDPKSFMTAVFCGLLTLTIILLGTERWLTYQSDKRLSAMEKERRMDVERHAEKLTEMAKAADRAMIRERDWRDSFQKYHNLYLEIKRN